VDPEATLHDLTRRCVRHPVPMLLPLVPEALEAPTILPSEDTKTMLRVIRVLAAKCSPIGPGILPTAMDDSLSPHAFKFAAI